MRKQFAALLSVVATVSLLLSACGTSPGADTGPITVGELFPMTGREPFVGQWFLHGAKVGIADINANGGCDGHQINAKLSDTGGDAVDAVTALKQLQLSNPAFILGPSSLEIEGVINTFDPSHLPDFVEGGTTQLDHMNNKYVWRTTPSDSTLAIGMAYFAIQKGYTNVGLFFESTSNASGVVDPLTKAFTKHGGTISDQELVTPHQSSYRSEVEKLFANNPQAIFMQTDPQTASTFFADVQQLGHMNVPFILTDAGADVNMAKAMGLANASKYMTGMNGSPPAGPAWQYYTQQYQKVWGTSQPVTLSQNTYDSVIIACLAMTAANSTDPTVWNNYVTKVAEGNGEVVTTYKDGVAALKAGKSINFNGASGSDDYNQYRNVAGSWDIVQWDTTGTTLNTVFTVSEAQIASWSV
ncbi:MAG TPA: ABC transporter substrate-binding protein [Ktedonobacterales bacterium]|jgi:ABC-type branched-subunit amino acid transport system substrate-binding protein